MFDTARRAIALVICPELRRPPVLEVHPAHPERESTLTQQIVRLAETYGTQRSLALSTVSTYAAGDGKFVPGLAAGNSCTVRRAQVVIQWFSDHWPADLAWPRDIPRPPRSKREAA